MDRKQKGLLGENRAAAEYIKGGYEIVTRNFFCRTGEIDIIAKNDEYLVFCEVKYRSTLQFGSGAQAVTPTKIKRIIRAAKEYLCAYEGNLQPRFDVAVVTEDGVEMIENAFGADDFGNSSF